ncbi:T9SS type A sorting domain-containing protein [Hymenobacter sp. DG25B]|uniref:T9SS type A sorting domain-containing protein n=1 Tax=Hymenobacter sp. DG25B TaxID=1385664 RepID=UPI0009E5089D|nr:T9SS type A sorting domain-containing protein [Hymenobacter sp. DG25B]
MKHTYMRTQKPVQWAALWMFFLTLFALPSLVQAQKLNTSGITSTGPFATTQIGQTTTLDVNGDDIIVTVKGSSLTQDVTVTVPDGFQVSLDGTTFVTTLTVPVANTSGGGQDVIVRFAPTVAKTYSGSLVLTSGTASKSFALSGTGLAPAPLLSINPSAFTFADTRVGEVSSDKTFDVAGQNLTGAITVTSNSTEFQILNPSTGVYGSTLTLNSANSATVNTTISVRFKPTVSSPNDRNGVLTISSSGAQSQSSALNGKALPNNQPYLSVSPTTLDFGTVSGTGSAQSLFFTVGGGNLTATDSIKLVRDNSSIQFRIKDSNTLFTGKLTIAPVNGQVPETTIEVRLRAVPAGVFNHNITVTVNNTALVQLVNIRANNPFANGTSAQSSVTALGASKLPIFSTVPGQASESRSYKVTGEFLVRPILITAPNNFQIALDSLFTQDVASNGFKSFSLTPNAAGAVAPTRVYVRYLPTVADLESRDISHVSQPATTVNVTVVGNSRPFLSITPASLLEFKTPIVINQKSEIRELTLTALRAREIIRISVSPDEDPANYNTTNKQQFEISLTGAEDDFHTFIDVQPSATTYSVDRKIYVRFVPTRVGLPVAEIRYKSTELYTTDSNGNQIYKVLDDRLKGSALAIEPTKQTEYSAVRSTDFTGATVTYIPAYDGDSYEANGFGRFRLVVVSEKSTLLPPQDNPKDGIAYNPGANGYQTGDQISPGFYVVASGSGTVATFTGLDAAKTYYVYVFDYNANNPGQNAINGVAYNFKTPTDFSPIPGKIIPGNPVILPVQLASFTAKLNNKRVDLNWATASEKNSKAFEVERSADGVSFQKLQSVAGQGNTTTRHEYAAIDAQPLVGTSYYRLKQVDTDGKFAYSGVATVNNTGNGVVAMYPNPVRDQLTIQLPGNVKGAVVTVADLTGRVQFTKTLSTEGRLDMNSLKPGIYVVTVVNGGQRFTQKIVKQ